MACAADKGGHSMVAARGIEGEFGDSKAGPVQGIDNDLRSQAFELCGGEEKSY